MPRKLDRFTIFGIGGGASEETLAYGVEWDEAVLDSIHRIGNSMLHAECPVQNAMRGCLLADDGSVVQYLSHEDWQNPSLLDGSKGQVMIEIPTFYWKGESDGTKKKVMFSRHKLKGYEKFSRCYVSAYEATLDRTNNKLASVKSMDARYRGGNNNSAWDAELRTLLGKPATAITRTNFRNYAHNRGEGWEMYLYNIHKMLYWLFVVEFCTLDSQKAVDASLTAEGWRKGGLGNGLTTIDWTKWSTFNSNYPVTPCGCSDALGNHTGEVSYTLAAGGYNTTDTIVKVPRFHGIENPFGHIWKNTDGVNVLIEADPGDSKVYVCNDRNYKDTIAENYTCIGNDARTEQYVKNLLGLEVIPSAVGTNYYKDYHYTNIPTSGSAVRTLLFGGLALNGADAGFVFASSRHAPASASAFIGSRLCFLPVNQ